MKNKVSNRLALSLIVFALLFFVSCGGSETKSQTEESNKQTEETGPVEVETAKATVRSLPKYIEGTGTFAADEESSVAPKTSGKVIATYANVGGYVRKGQVIARLDSRDSRLSLDEAILAEKQAVVAVRQAEARLGIGKNGKFNVSNSPEVQNAYQNYLVLVREVKQAKVNERRYAELLKTGDTSQITYDQHRTTAETLVIQAKAALKQYENAKNLARQNNQGIASAQASLQSARKKIEIARKAITDAVVYAPLSGSVAERPTSVGEFVSSSSTIIKIVRTNPIKLEISLSEAEAGRVNVGMGVSVSVVAYPNQNFAGRVAAIVPSLDADSRSIIVEAEINNSGGKLRPGMFGTAKLVASGSEQAVFVPSVAITNDPATERPSVYVIEDGVARLRVVRIGVKEDDSTGIISGIEENDAVITSNIEKLYDGVKVVQ